MAFTTPLSPSSPSNSVANGRLTQRTLAIPPFPVAIGPLYKPEGWSALRCIAYTQQRPGNLCHCLPTVSKNIKLPPNV